MNKTIHNTKELAASIEAIRRLRPGLKSSEIIPFAYRTMAQDMTDGLVQPTIWDDLIALEFNDEGSIEYTETRGICFDDNDFALIVSSNHPAAYLNRPGVSRAPVAYVTRMVVFYARRKLEKASESKKDIVIQNIDGMDLLWQVTTRATALIKAGEIQAILSFIGEESK